MTPQTERLDRIATHSLADQARTMIRKAIFEGKIKPEERLTIERIASELGISRTPVREALKLLEADGIIRMLPNRGAVVQRFDKQELAERYSLRAQLEGYAGEMACRARGAELADELDANWAVMETGITRLAELNERGEDDLDQISALLELNRRFHQIILGASGCNLVAKVLDSLHMPVAYRLYQWREPARRQAVLDHHRNIVEAFRKNQPRRVRKALEAHIEDVRDFVLSTGQ